MINSITIEDLCNNCGSTSISCSHERTVGTNQEIYDDYTHSCLSCKKTLKSKTEKVTYGGSDSIPDCPFCGYDWQKHNLELYDILSTLNRLCHI